ncbi:MAG TPA: hypothetical protein VH597_14835 [Verrucomicrobiae bacterium]|jgi:hypothetical protein|nr:hypothetical protein [Verrucomicrobiae bacterium]
MKIDYVMKSLTAALICVVAGCAQKSCVQKTTSTSTSVSPVKDIPVLRCWYVENNGAGQHGYAAQDGKFNYEYPDGTGLYQSIPQLRKAMQLQQSHTKVVVPQFGGEVPKGWKIRDLTTDEIDAVLGHKK